METLLVLADIFYFLFIPAPSLDSKKSQILHVSVVDCLDCMVRGE